MQTGMGTRTQMQAGAQGCRHRHGHRDTDVSTGTWMQADWKCEHKNKVKVVVKTTHQTHCRGRQVGWPQQVWPGVIGCESEA